MTDLLLIDDDDNLTELLAAYLQNQGYSVKVARNGIEGLRAMFDARPNLIILDVTMPLQDGWDILARIREVSDLPVIMLTARDEEPDVLRGFSLGADDYITKPFSFAQLGARITAVLSRVERTDEYPSKLAQGDIVIDLRTRQVWRDQSEIRLTPTEFKLLVVLMHHRGEVISSEDLVQEVWGPQYAGEVGYVRRYVWHLRQKLEPDPEQPRYIHNERGYGYRFLVAEDTP